MTLACFNFSLLRIRWPGCGSDIQTTAFPFIPSFLALFYTSTLINVLLNASITSGYILYVHTSESEQNTLPSYVTCITRWSSYYKHIVIVKTCIRYSWWFNVGTEMLTQVGEASNASFSMWNPILELFKDCVWFTQIYKRNNDYTRTVHSVMHNNVVSPSTVPIVITIVINRQTYWVREMPIDHALYRALETCILFEKKILTYANDTIQCRNPKYCGEIR